MPMDREAFIYLREYSFFQYMQSMVKGLDDHYNRWRGTPEEANAIQDNIDRVARFMDRFRLFKADESHIRNTDLELHAMHYENTHSGFAGQFLGISDDIFETEIMPHILSLECVFVAGVVVGILWYMCKTDSTKKSGVEEKMTTTDKVLDANIDHKISNNIIENSTTMNLNSTITLQTDIASINIPTSAEFVNYAVEPTVRYISIDYVPINNMAIESIPPNLLDILISDSIGGLYSWLPIIFSCPL